MPKNRVMKLYVWEDVFTDWFPGLAVALAYTVKEARELIASDYWPGRGVNWENVVKELTGVKPIVREITREAYCRAKPEAWQVAGGG
jgi:hypothetical protein